MPQVSMFMPSGRAIGSWSVCVCMMMCFVDHAAAQSSLQAQARTSAEFDDNALRNVQENAVGDGLMRYFLGLNGIWALDANESLNMSVKQGGKFFATQRDANTLLTQVSVGYAVRPVEQFTLRLNARMKDRTERASLQDYNRGSLGAEMTWRLKALELGVQGGWRYFAFKPDASTGSHGPDWGARARVGGRRWSLSAGYQGVQRRFDVLSFAKQEDTLVRGQSLRQDVLHVASLQGGFRGAVVLNVGGSYTVNRSNSYGQNFEQIRGDVTLTAPLFWSLYGSLRAELLQTTFDDPIFVDSVFQIDEDNRNTVVAALAWPFAEHWDVALRYSLYTQALGSQTDYQRQLFSFALGWSLE